MSTRSFICKKELDGSLTGIYCHWDGYPEYVGQILYDHYNNPERVDSLIALGDLSSLGPVLTPAPGEEHTFDSPQKFVTVAYGRDRKEKDVETKKNLTYNFMTNSWACYCYIYKNNKWYVIDLCKKSRKMKLLSEVLKESDSSPMF